MNPKSFVLPVFVCSTFQIPVQVKNIPLNIKLKRHNIRLVPFIGLECLPPSETEFWEEEIINQYKSL